MGSNEENDMSNWQRSGAGPHSLVNSLGCHLALNDRFNWQLSVPSAFLTTCKIDAEDTAGAKKWADEQLLELADAIKRYVEEEQT